MLVRSVVEQLPIPRAPFCLDLCAAPGGKSIAILDAIDERGFLISNEVIKARTRILIENLRKWGRPNWLPASGHPSSWSAQEEMFDLILVDAPCSGEGMFRKEPNALREWSEENVHFCAQRQSSILSDIIPCLKEGGFLIYSTCTYSEAENEDRLVQLEGLGLSRYEVSIPEEWGFVKAGGNSYQAYPHRVKGEGFFLSVFVRGEIAGKPSPQLSAMTESFNDPIAISIPVGFKVEQEGDSFALVSEHFEGEIVSLSTARLLLARGLDIGAFKGKNFMPSHALAMSDLVLDATHVPLDQEQSIKYLRRETFPIAVEKDGWYLMTFENSVLGWAKVAAGRMKNHYPKEWMIRKRW